MADLKNLVSQGGQAIAQKPAVQIRGHVEINGAVVAPNTGPPGAQPGHSAHHKVICNYCTSLFLINPHRNQCPNCGAPASA